MTIMCVHFNKRLIISDCKDMRYTLNIIKSLKSRISTIVRSFLFSFNKDFYIIKIE